MFNKKIISAFAAATILSLPLLANASLTVINDTSKDSTSRINGACSQDVLGAGGITPHNTTKTYSDFEINAACRNNKENCLAVVYIQTHCSGPVLANISYNAKTQEIKDKEIKPLIDGFKIKVESSNTIRFTEIPK